jgi:hypothetical protein
MRGGAVWQLVGLITRRSQVQILPPLPNISARAPAQMTIRRSRQRGRRFRLRRSHPVPGSGTVRGMAVGSAFEGAADVARTGPGRGRSRGGPRRRGARGPDRRELDRWGAGAAGGRGIREAPPRDRALRKPIRFKQLSRSVCADAARGGPPMRDRWSRIFRRRRRASRGRHRVAEAGDRKGWTMRADAAMMRGLPYGDSTGSVSGRTEQPPPSGLQRRATTVAFLLSAGCARCRCSGCKTTADLWNGASAPFLFPTSRVAGPHRLGRLS